MRKVIVSSDVKRNKVKPKTKRKTKKQNEKQKQFINKKSSKIKVVIK